MNETALGDDFFIALYAVLRLTFEELAGLASRSAEGLTEELWTALVGGGLADCGGRCAIHPALGNAVCDSPVEIQVHDRGLALLIDQFKAG